MQVGGAIGQMRNICLDRIEQSVRTRRCLEILLGLRALRRDWWSVHIVFDRAVLGVHGTRIVQRVREVDGERIALLDTNDRRCRKRLVDKTEVRITSADPGTGAQRQRHAYVAASGDTGQALVRCRGCGARHGLRRDRLR